MIQPHPKVDFTCRRHPEKRIDGFTALDGTIRFFSFVKSILLKTNAKHVLDFGAGRGDDDPSRYRRHIRDLRTYGATVTACDVDEAVREHRCSHIQVIIKPREPLPFPDESFDVIVSDMTFEHIEDNALVASELMRILRSGGYICARTPNRYGYVRLLTGLVPNRLHARALQHIQPDRKAEDVFPTVYMMNSVSQVRRLFPGCNIYHFHDSAEPAYHFGNRFLYEVFMLVHKILPSRLATTICLFIEKPARPARGKQHDLCTPT